MDEQPLHTPSSSFGRAWRTFLNVSLVLVLVIVASLIGVGGASLFIYRQMSKDVAATKVAAGKGRGGVSTYVPARRALPVDPNDPDESNSTFNAASELADDGQPVRRAAPVYRPQGTPQNAHPFQLPDNTSVFPRR